ncbi:MAG: mechanosensitive ion channel family protein [Syntrophobacterales bacterium]|nr:mechanosensitive ion channel family protein [Syntrophobacterales bacterium]
MSESLEITGLILPLAFFAGSILAGLVFEKTVLRKLKKIAEKTKWKGDEIVISELRGKTFFWFVIAGIYLAILNIPIREDIFNILQKILLVIVIASVTIVFARIAVGFVNSYAGKAQGVLPLTSISSNLVNVLILATGILIILQSLGISITPMLTAFGVGGLAVALALQDTLSNLFSGLHIIISKQVAPGDYVKLDTGEAGYVTDIAWRNTTIRAISNNMIVVPNSKLASAIITNYCQPEKEMSVLIQVGVSYDSDLEKVEKVTIEVAREVMEKIQGGISEFEPFIRYHTFGDSSINFSVILRTREFVNQYIIKHEFIKKLHKRYQKEGIEIPFPITTVYMHED